MKLTCLHCGKQIEQARNAGSSTLPCDCGRDVTSPSVLATGIRPSSRAADRARYRAFLSAGLINDRWQSAVISAICALFLPPLAIASTIISITVLRSKAGSLARYAGYRAARLALILGLFNALISSGAYYHFYQAHELKNQRYWQKTAARDLRALGAAQSSFSSSYGHFGSFKEIAFIAPEGLYTLCMGHELKKPRSGPLKAVAACPDLADAASDNNFRALAIADLDGDGKLDIWSINEDGTITHVQDDLAN